MTQEEYLIVNNCFEFDGKTYDCTCAIERDMKMIVQEAETSHKDTFNELYDRKSLKAEKVRLFFENGQLLYGMVLYTIYNKADNYKRGACGGYYPFWDNQLFPHPYQESICW